MAYRKNRDLFDSIVKSTIEWLYTHRERSLLTYVSSFTAQVEASKKDIPPGFQMPKSEKDFMLAAPAEIEEDENL